MIFALFDVILYVESEKREHFDDVVDAIDAEMTSEIDEFLDRSGNMTDSDIENFDIVVDEMIDEIVCEIVEILSLSLLKFRFEATLFIFFAWCWRTCWW